MSYSPYFKTIIDERESGLFGRGSHISILECLMPIEDQIKKYRFGVVWDEDHDERVIKVIEHLYSMGLMNDVIFIGERKGNLTIVFDDGFTTQYDIPQNYIDSVEAVCDTALEYSCGGDNWPVNIFPTIEDSEGYLMQGSQEFAIGYLKGVQAQWGLGLYLSLFYNRSLHSLQ